VKLSKFLPPNSADVFVKLEYYNTTGSYKDRMVLAIIEEAERRGTRFTRKFDDHVLPFT
jgi:cysteine synthase A